MNKYLDEAFACMHALEKLAADGHKLICDPLAESKLEDFQKKTLWAMSFKAYRSTYSIRTLLTEAAVFDADIMLRIVIEATINIVYLTHNRDDFDRLFDEYAIFLPSIESKRWINHLNTAIENSPDIDHTSVLYMRSSLDRENARPWPAMDKAQIHKLRNSWNVITMIDLLSKSGIFAKHIVGLKMTYMRSSFLVHSNYRGVSASAFRTSLPPEERSARNIVHMLRILSNAASCVALRLKGYTEFLGMDAESNIDILKGVDECISLSDYVTEEYGIADPPKEFQSTTM